MSSAGMDAVTDLDTLFTDNWTAANTDNITPLITDNLQTPWETLDFGVRDHVYVKYDTELINTALYATDFIHRVALTVEVMTARFGTMQAGRAHFEKLLEEAARIIKANPRRTGYAMSVLKGTRARYNKERGIFIGTMDVEVLKVMTT